MKVDPIGLTPDPQQQADFTNQEKRDELAREIHLREVVYPGMVRSGRLTYQQAERHTNIMRSIWKEYAARVDDEKKQREPELPLEPAASSEPSEPSTTEPKPGE